MRFAIALLSATCLVGCEDVDDEPDEAVTGIAIGAEGGFVTSHDGVFTAVFPRDTLPDTFVITVRLADDAPDSLGFAYSVQGMSSIRAPIFLEYRYALPQIQGLDTARLDLGRQTGSHWQPLPLVGHNESTQTVAASDATVATAYALIIDDTPQEEDVIASSGGETTDGDPRRIE